MTWVAIILGVYWLVPTILTTIYWHWTPEGEFQTRLGLAGANLMIFWLKPAEGVAKLTLIAVLVWVAMLLGWDPPTPENVRKLEAEIQAESAKP